jgi:hypothetical protein
VMIAYLGQAEPASAAPAPEVESGHA